MFRFRRFQTRLLVLFLALFTLTQAVALGFSNWAGRIPAGTEIRNALEVSAGVFSSLLEERDTRLLQAAVLLADDFAFKSAYATRDGPTIESMLHNHGHRIGADIMYLLSLDSEVIASTLGEGEEAAAFIHPELLAAAQADPHGEATAIVLIDGEPFQLVVVPVLIPRHDAWVAMGFAVDDPFVAHFREVTQSHISLMVREETAWRPLASTLPAAERQALSDQLATNPGSPGSAFNLRLAGEDYVSLLYPLGMDDQRQLMAGMHRSLDAAMAPYARLQRILLVLMLLGLGLTAVGAVWVARRVSGPVRQLREGAVRIAEGDYRSRVHVRQRDELGALGRAFNRMAHGLEDRDRVRGLLGKVVSPAIAEELLSRDIELGGEEREVSILFADIVGFTALAERLPPSELLDFLNHYLTRLSGDIEANQGVIDKYIGDAVMAVFAAPLPDPYHASHAVAAALAMQQSMQALNMAEADGRPDLQLRVGINSGTAVAGNMGSADRLNYTVVGDAVNLASRLEGLTRRYGVPVIVSQATRDRAPQYLYRELDRVRVKGRKSPVSVHEPLMLEAMADADTLAELGLFAEALDAYRSRQWSQAAAGFSDILKRRDDPVAGLYLDIISRYRQQPPSENWDGSATLVTKSGDA